jgi:hypothetical protein
MAGAQKRTATAPTGSSTAIDRTYSFSADSDELTASPPLPRIRPTSLRMLATAQKCGFEIPPTTKHQAEVDISPKARKLAELESPRRREPKILLPSPVRKKTLFHGNATSTGHSPQETQRRDSRRRPGRFPGDGQATLQRSMFFHINLHVLY